MHRVDPTEADVDSQQVTLPLESRTRGHAPASARDPLVGAMLGHFRVDAPIGKGGMGAVYRAWDTSLERDVALKTLLFDGPAARARFLHEARTQAKLRHPHVVPIHFIGDDKRPDGRSMAYLVMELVEGESLANLLRRAGRVTEERALDLIDAMASALEAAQAKGLVHRDVKPSNVLLDRDGRPMLADFGLAKQVSLNDEPDGPMPKATNGTGSAGGDLTDDGVIIGTPAYVAPEQARGERIDHRADIYALGITLFELIMGRPPFNARSNAVLLAQHQALQAPAPDARPPVAALVLRMLAKDPDARFATYADLRAAIAAARPPPMGPASFFPRAAAFFIDLMPLMLVAGLVDWLVMKRLGWPAAAVLLGLVEAHWGGATPGKRLMHLTTLDTHDAPPSSGVSVVRALIKLWGPIATVIVGMLDLKPGKFTVAVGGSMNSQQPVANLTMGIFVLWVVSMFLAFGRRRATLHDRLTRTRVVSSLIS